MTGRPYEVVFFRHMVSLLGLRCHFCGGDVAGSKHVIHHIDEDETNNDISNLTLAHLGCHSSHHNAGRAKPEGFGERVSASLRRHYAAHPHLAKGTKHASH